MSNEPRQNALAGATLKALMNSDHATKIAALAAVDANIAAELASKHLPVPKDIEGWKKLARIVEIPEESISELTPIEICDRAMEWAKKIQVEAKRRKIKALLEAKAEAEIAAPATPPPPGASETKEATQRPIQGGFLGGEKLADALGIPRERRDAFFKQLERERESLGNGSWIKVRKKRPNDVQYMYRMDSLRLQDLAKRYREPKIGPTQRSPIMPPKPNPPTARRVCMSCGKNLDRSRICKTDECHQRNSEIVMYMASLVRARIKGDYLTAANAHRELERRGVLVRFLRKRKGNDGR